MIIITGSCSLEDFNETFKQAKFCSENNIKYLRTMIWKPRTTKDSFQGIGWEEGYKILSLIHKTYPELTFVTEAMASYHISLMQDSGLPFVYQVGTRNSQNYHLLKSLGQLHNEIILYKRGMWMTVDEYLGGASYLEPSKNSIWLCLRGIRTFDTSMRNTPDIGTILVLKKRFQYLDDSYKIIFDPSHACGDRHYVRQMSKIAKIAGADGLEIETHSSPDDAKSDAHQTIDFLEMNGILEDLNV